MKLYKQVQTLVCRHITSRVWSFTSKLKERKKNCFFHRELVKYLRQRVVFFFVCCTTRDEATHVRCYCCRVDPTSHEFCRWDKHSYTYTQIYTYVPIKFLSSLCKYIYLHTGCPNLCHDLLRNLEEVNERKEKSLGTMSSLCLNFYRKLRKFRISIGAKIFSGHCRLLWRLQSFGIEVRDTLYILTMCWSSHSISAFLFGQILCYFSGKATVCWCHRNVLVLLPI